MTVPPVFLALRAPAIGLLLLATPAVSQIWQDISANVPGTLSEEQFGNMASDGARLYVLGQKGVFVSADNGGSFSAINAVSGGGPDLGEMSLRFVKFVDGEVWVSGSGVTDTPGLLGPRLHRLVPGESVWRPSAGGYPVGIGEGVADDLAHDPISSSHFITLSTGEIYVSSDGGDNWEKSVNSPGGIGSPSSVVAADGAFLSSRPLAGVVKSADQGLSWTGVRSFGQESIGNMIARNGRLLITAGRAVHFSDDAGNSWHQVGNVPHGNSVLSGDGTNVFAVSRNFTAQEVLAYSASGGLTWHTLTRDGLPPIPTFSGYFVQHLFRHGDFLFLRGKTLNNSFLLESTQLHRLDISAFDFINDFQIVIQPEGKGLLAGQTHELEVYASGVNLTYQWQRDGEDLPGETSRTLLLDNAQAADSGDYTVLVKSGAAPAVPSAVATVTVFERADGRWDPIFDQSDIDVGGRVHLLPNGEAIVVRTDSTSQRIYRIGADGGRLQNSSTTTSSGGRSLSFIDQDGRIVLGAKPQGNTTAIWRYNSETFAFQSSLFFPPNTSANRIRDMIEVPGRGYAVVGGFSTVGSTALEDFALIGYDNVPVAGYPGGAGPDFNTGADSVTVDAAGNIYVAGSFTAWSGVSTPLRVARFDPEGNVSAVTAGLGGLPVGTYGRFVHALDDGRLLLGVGTANEFTLHAVNADGNRDESFNTAGHTVANLRRVVQQADGKILVVGGFTSYGGVPAAGYVRLNPDGTVDESFYTATGFSSGTINDVAYDPRGYIYLSAATSGGSSSATFQGQGPVGRGPVRIFTTPADTGLGGDTFADWPALASLPVDQRGPDAMPANDGVANLVKFALGVNPLESAAGRLPPTVIEAEHEEDEYPAVAFIRSQSAAGVEVNVEVSGSLDFDENLGSTVVSVEDLGDGTERVTVRSNASFASRPRQFFRLDVSER